MVVAEFTTTTLVSWVIVALVVGLVLGWLLRPWLIRDKLVSEYEEKLDNERAARSAAETNLAAATTELASAQSDLEAARADLIRSNTELASTRAELDGTAKQLADVTLDRDAALERLGEPAPAGLGAGVLAERDAEIARLQADLDAIRDLHSTCDVRIAEREAEIAELQKATGDAATPATETRQE
jgi:chromosome segregation ATPase